MGNENIEGGRSSIGRWRVKGRNMVWQNGDCIYHLQTKKLRRVIEGQTTSTAVGYIRSEE